MTDPCSVGDGARLSMTLIQKLRQILTHDNGRQMLTPVPIELLTEAADALEAQQEALQPFVTVAGQLSKGCPDNYVLVPWTDLTAKAFRVAAKVLPVASSEHARSKP